MVKLELTTSKSSSSWKRRGSREPFIFLRPFRFLFDFSSPSSFSFWLLLLLLFFKIFFGSFSLFLFAPRWKKISAVVAARPRATRKRRRLVFFFWQIAQFQSFFCLEIQFFSVFTAVAPSFGWFCGV